MGLLRTIALFTAAVSLFTFVAFFGRLPAFRQDMHPVAESSCLMQNRNTPIGFLHRLVVLRIPSALRSLDLRLTNGRITDGGARLGHYLMNDKHPVVMIFFLGLVTASTALFLPTVWPLIPTHHKLLVPLIVPTPYLFTYLCARKNNQTMINESNHAAQMRNYPYDRILFFPGQCCSTCQFLKPPRSKHCSICKSCVSRMDHHCVWVNNCIGRGNHKWFLALLLFTAVLIAYGAYLAYIALTPLAELNYKKYEGWYRYKPDRGADLKSWGVYLDMKVHYFLTWLSIYIEEGGVSAAGVGLLALMTWPLPLGLLAYQLYLVYAGMTTNESSKWSDWRDDMADGVVFLGKRRTDTMRDYELHNAPLHAAGRSGQFPDEEEEPPTTWPLESRHILIRTTNGQPPTNLPPRIQCVADKEGFERVWDLAAVENVYDLGFWDNLLDILRN